MGFFAAIGAVFKAISATWLGGFLVSTAISVGASLLAQKLFARKPPAQRPVGTQIPAQTAGEDVSQGFLLGYRATSGHLVYRNSHGSAGGRPNAYLVEVIEVSDISRVTLQGLLVDDRVAQIGTTEQDFGFPLTNIAAADGSVCAWVKFLDGTQTEADPYLFDTFGGLPGYSWTTGHVGTGIAYAILTYRYDREVFQGLPRATFILGGIPLYDPRQDSSVGGSGAQRWDNPATWQPSGNPSVQIYNILRGILLPTGEIYGGGVAFEDIPLANAVAGMNVCDTPIGQRPQFETSIEVRVAADEPASIIEELLGASLGQIAETGGVWRTRFGAPAAPVFSFTDGDVSISDAQAFEPIKGLEATHNAIVATYLEPADLWQPRTTDLLRNPIWEAEDGGRLLPVDIQLGPVTNRNQANQIKAALIRDERRQRQHSLVLPPDAMGLDPLDDIRWTSAVNGYADKDFEVVQTLWRARSGMMQVTLRERDPDDYDWRTDDDLPLPPDVIPLPPRTPLVVPGWAVTATSIPDGEGNARRPALRLSWSDGDFYATQLIRWQVRLAATQATVLDGVAPARDLQHQVIEGIVPDTAYEARGLLLSDGRPSPWSAWLGAVAPDLRISRSDVDDQLRAEFEIARDLLDGTVEHIGGVVGELRNRIEVALAPLDVPNLPATPAIPRIDLTLDGVQVEISDLHAALTDAAGEIAANASALSGLAITVSDQGGAITAQAQDITELRADVTAATGGVSANAGAIAGLDARVTSAEGGLIAQASDITELHADLLSLEADVSGNATAISGLTTTLSQQGANISAIAEDVTELQTGLSTADSEIEANATAVSGLTTRVETAEGQISAISTDVSALDAGLTAAEGGIAVNAGAVSGIEVRVTSAEGEIASQASDISQLQAGLTDAEGEIAANASALSGLASIVSDQGGAITAQAQDITDLHSGLSTAQSGIDANATAVTGLTTRVETAEGEIASQASDISHLQAGLTGAEGEIAANASALSGLASIVSDQGGAITAQAQDITELQSGLSNAEGEIAGNATAISNVVAQVSDIDGDVSALSGRTGTLEAQVQTPGTGILARVSSIEAAYVDADGAVAAVNQQVSAEYGSVSAMAEATAFAEASANGTLSGFVFSLSGVGVLQAIAVQPNGQQDPSVSVRLAGANIILDGNVQVTESFQVGGGGTGERAVTTKDGLRVYDANNVARIIIGLLD